MGQAPPRTGCVRHESVLLPVLTSDLCGPAAASDLGRVAAKRFDADIPAVTREDFQIQIAEISRLKQTPQIPPNPPIPPVLLAPGRISRSRLRVPGAARGGT